MVAAEGTLVAPSRPSRLDRRHSGLHIGRYDLASIISERLPLTTRSFSLDCKTLAASGCVIILNTYAAVMHT